jgi:hypothetical protein
VGVFGIADVRNGLFQRGGQLRDQVQTVVLEVRGSLAQPSQRLRTNLPTLCRPRSILRS